MSIEWKSIKWTLKWLQCKGKAYYFIIDFSTRPSLPCWYSPASLTAPGMLLLCLLRLNFANVCNTVTGTCLGLQNAGLTSDLSHSLHLPELRSPGARNGWKDEGWRGLVPKLSLAFYLWPLERPVCSMCMGSTMVSRDHCREDFRPVHIIGPHISGGSDLKDTMGVLKQKTSPPDSLMKLRININKVCIEVFFFFLARVQGYYLRGKLGQLQKGGKKNRKAC